MTAIPVFLVRAFHHGAILVNTKAGIRTPKDLEGKKVGVNRGYTVTTGVWARSILQQEYGVDLSKITWVLSGDEHVAEYRPPANVVPIAQAKKMADMLVSGELPAAIGVEADHPDVAPLIPNALEAGLKSLRDNSRYPINHLVVIKDELLAANTDLAADVFNTFAAAKRLYVDRLKAGKIESPTGVDSSSTGDGHHGRTAALRHHPEPADHRRPYWARADAGHHYPPRDRGGPVRTRHPRSCGMTLHSELRQGSTTSRPPTFWQGAMQSSLLCNSS